MATFNADNAFGAQYVPVQLGLCLGGLITTWGTDSPTPRLWSVQDGAALSQLMYQGKISKVGRAEDLVGRYREAGMLDGANKVLSVSVEGETEPRLFPLGEPIDVDGKQTSYDIIGALRSAIQYVTDGGAKMLLLERGGLTAPKEPFALFTLDDGKIVVEARPAPRGSAVWDKLLKPGQTAGLVSAPMSEEGLRAASVFLAEAARTWGVTPWDLTLTYETI